MNIPLWCDRVIRAGFILLFALVPLILTPWNYELFEYNKMMMTYGLTAVIVGAWIIKMIAKKEFRVARTPLDIPIALFFVSQLVSAFFSLDQHVSWFGYYSRFNGGMWSVISYILLYYALVTNRIPVLPMVFAALTSGAVVAVYGALERLGIDKNLWVQDVQNRVFSTLGQPNWLAAYLVALSPIAMGLALKNKKVIALVILFFTVLLFTRSRSGLVGFAAAELVFWGLLLWKTKNFSRVRVPFFIVHIAFVILIAWVGTSVDSIDQWLKRTPIPTSTSVATASAYTAPLLESGGTESGTIRKYVWQGAVDAWKSSQKTMLIGTGTETFAFAFYQYRPKEHNLTSEWDFLYNKAHNEYLNYLTTTGIFGLGSYLLIIGVFVLWFLKTKNKHDALGDALFAGWASILVTNFFGFSVVVLQLFFFLIPAFLFVSSELPYRTKHFKLPYQTMWVVLLGTALVVFLIGRAWCADIVFAKGYRGARLGQYELSKKMLLAAIKLNPTEPLYHDEAASTFSVLASLAIENQDGTAAATLARESIRESDLAIKVSPNNVNYWKTRTKILYALAPFDPTFTKAAITALETAKGLSPNDPKIHYNLAILSGQNGDTTRAVELLKNAITLKPNYRDAYWALHIFYNESGRSELAKSTLNEYLTLVDPNDREFQEAL